MKTIIVYDSKHHGNTYKLVEAIANKNEVDTVNVRNAEIVNLAQYDRIGFASGIAYSKPYKNIMTYAQENLPANKEVFFVYTCGKLHSKYELPMKELAESRNCKFLGSYSCPGYDTYGPFKLIGGINKSRPDTRDLWNARSFYDNLSQDT